MKNALKVTAEWIFDQIQGQTDWERLFSGASRGTIGTAQQWSGLSAGKKADIVKHFVGVTSEAPTSSDEIIVHIKSNLVSVATTDADKAVDFVEGLASDSYDAAKSIATGDEVGSVKGMMKVLHSFVKYAKPNKPNDPIHATVDLPIPLGHDKEAEDAKQGPLKTVDVRLSLPVLFYVTDEDDNDDCSFNLTVTLTAQGVSSQLELHDYLGKIGGAYLGPDFKASKKVAAAKGSVELETPSGKQDVNGKQVQIRKNKWYWLMNPISLGIDAAPVGKSTFDVSITIAGATGAQTDPSDNATYLMAGPMKLVLEPNH